MNQNDRDFLRAMMRERIAQHYAAKQDRDSADKDRFCELEDRLNEALSHLSEEQAKDVHQYLEYFFEQSGENELFFYRCGLLDGYKLCQIITAWINQT